ncbi:MAG: hypothetical protein MUE52_07490 [Tabrizicola sp.]|jgi:hypothetical protein|nr:hypothetical protein [Tabrizicola sp.]
MSVGHLSGLLRLRHLQAERARRRLADAVAAENAARSDQTDTAQRTALAATERQEVLAEMSRQVGAVRDIFRFSALTEDHATTLEREAEVRQMAAEAVETSVRLVEEMAARARRANRFEEKTTEMLAVMRRAEARNLRRATTRREEEDAGAGRK